MLSCGKCNVSPQSSQRTLRKKLSNKEYQLLRSHLRKLVTSKNELARKLKELEIHIKDHDEQIQVIFEAIQQLISFSDKRGNKIGYIKENQANYGKGSRKN